MDIPRDHFLRLGNIIALLLAPILAASAQPLDHQQTIEKEFTVSPGQTLTLVSDLGAVKVTSGTGNNLIVRVIKGVESGDRARAEHYFDRFEVEMRQTNQGVEIEGHYDNPNVRRGRNPLRVVYEIQVPRTFDVDLKTAGGAISIAGVDGDVRMRTSGGSISVSDIGGMVMAHTSGGSVSADNIVGNATLETSGGSISVRDMEGAIKLETSGGSITAERVDGDLYAHTSGGSVRLAELRGSAEASTSGGSVTADVLGQPAGKLDLSTSGGSVTVRVDPSIRASVVASASGGRVNSELPIAGSLERTHVRGDLNGGGPALSLRSSGGSVNILQR